jgi:hypothetical protein
MKIGRLFKWWCVSLLIGPIVVTVSIRWLDVPIARFFFGGSSRVVGLGQVFGSSKVVACDAALMLMLVLVRVVRGSIPDYAKVVFVACCASLCVFAANDYILKPVFGRYGPYAFLGNPAMQVFNLFHGDQYSVFPSGHMVISTTFAVVLVTVYPRIWPIFAGLLGAAGLALLVGDWHFLSDIIAGSFIGANAGLMAGNLWLLHGRLYPGKAFLGNQSNST